MQIRRWLTLIQKVICKGIFVLIQTNDFSYKKFAKRLPILIQQVQKELKLNLKGSTFILSQTDIQLQNYQDIKSPEYIQFYIKSLYLS
ncbi:unnamed protein product [Paramecium sonneborni]|uniref:Uncharacterized protein n=1 Tax=Paramecium sonneborni TaxID=65129 RepID=A0A8S1N9C7_9CILI|nr:unnamed protein product [Paramecium sonneborni]